MQRRIFALLAFALAGACAPDPTTSTTGASFPAAPAAREDHGSAAGDAFDAKVFGAFASHPGNFVYSPASLTLALETLREGARGATASEIDAALGRAGSKPTTLAQELAPAVAVANGLFVDDQARLEPSFVNLAARRYGARVETVDFHDHPDAARLRINRWVADRTNDRVRDLLAAGAVRRDTRMLVVDAIHMKASWMTPFPRPSTHDEPFHLASGGTKNVPTMHGRVAATLGEHAGARVLELPYVPSRSGASLALIVLLPKKDKSLNAVESAYRREGVAPFADSATRPGRIDVALPRFAVSSSGDLADALRALGVRRAFTDQADFSGISSEKHVELSSVVQHATAEVDESGTEASAASTGGTVEITSARIEEPLAFRVDRPFIFVIRDRASGVVLFSGRVEDPP